MAASPAAGHEKAMRRPSAHRPKFASGFPWNPGGQRQFFASPGQSGLVQPIDEPNPQGDSPNPAQEWFFGPAFLRRFLTSRIFIMNNTARFLSIAAVAAFASFGAQADEADASQFATKFETNRTRAEVAAEAATVAQTRSIEPAGSRVVTYKSTADRAAVRAQAAEAVRTGQISYGERG
ncbi:hypothetical protein DAPPUDRAFT_125871 [Daphnia pulex]|uniref:DUF4148 domain-containing protein n=2 Tax=cellular organisms TaxID=131567 RepID=E9I7M3_DAPPU|nr:hypothetical protein DAPPUDRAFT_125871 [Daphnia pulex]|eukprot:EFX60006.1 hypothetical protein DAPPUDRAFT_125871 [Daphnia pulex]